MKATLEFKILTEINLFVVVYGPDDPSNADWLDYLASAERADFATHAQLIVTHGGAPTFAQRRFLADVMGSDAVRVAVMSDSEAVCALVKAMATLNSGIEAFPPDRYHDALEHLQIDGRHLPAIEDVVLVLRTRMRLL